MAGVATAPQPSLVADSDLQVSGGPAPDVRLASLREKKCFGFGQKKGGEGLGPPSPPLDPPLLPLEGHDLIGQLKRKQSESLQRRRLAEFVKNV